MVRAWPPRRPSPPEYLCLADIGSLHRSAIDRNSASGPFLACCRNAWLAGPPGVKSAKSQTDQLTELTQVSRCGAAMSAGRFQFRNCPGAGAAGSNSPRHRPHVQTLQFLIQDTSPLHDLNLGWPATTSKPDPFNPTKARLRPRRSEAGCMVARCGRCPWSLSGLHNAVKLDRYC